MVLMFVLEKLTMASLMVLSWVRIIFMTMTLSTNSRQTLADKMRPLSIYTWLAYVLSFNWTVWRAQEDIQALMNQIQKMGRTLESLGVRLPSQTMVSLRFTKIWNQIRSKSPKIGQ